MTNLVRAGAPSTQRAKLPGLVAPRTGDAAMDRWAQAVTERLEVREGNRGNPWERVVTLRELSQLGLDPTAFNLSRDTTGGVLVQQPGGLMAMVSIDEFTDKIRGTKLYKELLRGLDDPARFDEVPERVRALLLIDIAQEASKRGAEIRRLEEKIQSTEESLAFQVNEVTAAVQGAAAGVRETTYAFANANRATAGKITQVQARLDRFSLDGSPGEATLEETLRTIADRTDGLEASYFLKVQVEANGSTKVAGFGISATSDPAGNQDSAFIVLADKFAVVTPNDTIPDPKNPPLNRIPFGVDSTGVYINGRLRVNATGPAIEEISRSVTLTATSTVFKVSAAGTPNPSAITLTVTLNGGLAGTPVFSVIDGSASLSGSGLSRSLAYGNMATDRVTVRVSVTQDGKTYNNDLTIYKAFDGQQGTPGTPGLPGGNGEPGAPGPRGSVTRYGSGSSFSDAVANSLVPGGVPVIGDTVTISNGSTFAETRYWSGFGWISPGVVIDGNLLVNGTLSAGTIAARKVRIEPSLSVSTSPLFVNDGIGDLSYFIPGGVGTPLFTVACTPPANCLVSILCTFLDPNNVTFRLFVYNVVTNTAYSGAVTNFRLVFF